MSLSHALQSNIYFQVCVLHENKTLVSAASVIFLFFTLLCNLDRRRNNFLPLNANNVGNCAQPVTQTNKAQAVRNDRKKIEFDKLTALFAQFLCSKLGNARSNTANPRRNELASKMSNFVDKRKLDAIRNAETDRNDRGRKKS